VAVPLELLDRRPVQARCCAANREVGGAAHQMWVDASPLVAAVVGGIDRSSPVSGRSAPLRIEAAPGTPGEETSPT
jgi:hypothetical protein